MLSPKNWKRDCNHRDTFLMQIEISVKPRPFSQFTDPLHFNFQIVFSGSNQLKK